MKKEFPLQILSGFLARKSYYVFLLIFSFSSVLFANTNASQTTGDDASYQSNVSGTVTDENDAPMTGVSIVEKGTTNGVITGSDGTYSISLAGEESVLVFSFVGYLTKEITVGSSTSIDVKMELDVEQLDELIVIGYGSKKKSELTNAVAQTSGDEIKKSSAISVSNTISGKLAGVYVRQSSAIPGFDDAQILVRGYNTYRDNSALIVIDGVANADPDGLNRLDPNDIETISVLKDASAAIYGAQSAGGVILVTTKRGRSGTPTFDFSTTQSFQSPTMKVKSADVFEYMDVLNANRILDGGSPDFPEELIDAFRTGERRAEDWYEALVDPPISQNRHSLSMRGGTDKIRYYASIGTANQGGILRGDDKTSLRQYNVRSNLDVSVTDNLEVGVDLSYRQKDTQQPQGGSGQIGAFASTSPLQEAYIGGDYRYPGEGWSQLNPAARLLSPGYARYKADVANATLRFKYDMPFLEGLSLEGFGSIVKTMHYDKAFNYTWVYYERNSAGEIVERPSRTVEDIGLREDFNQSLRITLNAKLGYERIFGQNKVSAFLAYEQMEYNTNFFWAQRLGYDSPQIDQLFAGSTNRSNWNNDGSASESARQNFFGRGSYEYANKYLLSFNFRYDGSPIFPEETRWGFFPGVSAGWVVSEESFMENSSVINNLKIRASWGQLGNDRVDPFQYIGAFGYSTGWVVDGTDVRGIEATTTPNPNITWEVTTTTDIGLELGLLQNRLTFELDGYKTLTTNILGERQASIPTYTGLSLPDENIGEMESIGFEVVAGFKQRFGELAFNVSGNFSYNDNKIIFFDEVPQAEPYQKQEGLPFGTSLLYEAIGIYRTQQDVDSYVSYAGAGLGDLIFADKNNDGVIDNNDRYRTRTSAFPKMQFGLNFDFDYKGFDLNVFFQGLSGSMWRLSNGFNSGAAGNGLAYVANNSYSLDNENAELPRIRPNGTGASDSDFWYHNSTWVRLKTVQLGYNLPKKLSSAIRLQNVRLYVSGENLFMIYNNLKKYGAGDPEFLSGSGGVYPNMRTITLGLNLTF